MLPPLIEFQLDGRRSIETHRVSASVTGRLRANGEQQSVYFVAMGRASA